MTGWPSAAISRRLSCFFCFPNINHNVPSVSRSRCGIFLMAGYRPRYTSAQQNHEMFRLDRMPRRSKIRTWRNFFKSSPIGLRETFPRSSSISRSSQNRYPPKADTRAHIPDRVERVFLPSRGEDPLFYVFFLNGL